MKTQKEEMNMHANKAMETLTDIGSCLMCWLFYVIAMPFVLIILLLGAVFFPFVYFFGKG
jgi:hypothetical protein